jgi:hypothetical protein
MKRQTIEDWIKYNRSEGHPHYWCGDIETHCGQCNMDHPMTELHLSMLNEERALLETWSSDSLLQRQIELMDLHIHNYDRNTLVSLIRRFRSVVKRSCDDLLAKLLEEDVLARDTPRLRTKTIITLAKWCDTDGIYSAGMQVAKEISLLLFGKILDRRVLGV